MTGGMGGHQGSAAKTDHWLTPPCVVGSLGAFDLDPCYSEPRPWPTATTMWGRPEDGLSRKWFGRVWCNPPYGNQTGRWLEKMAAHGNGVALVFARVETKAWFCHVWPKTTAVLFMKSPRLHFFRGEGSRAPHNCGAPTALLAYGRANALALEVCGIAGHMVEGNMK